MVLPPADATKQDLSDYWVAEGEKYWSQSDKTVQSAIKSLEYIDKAISIDPLNYKAWGDKGFLLKQMGEYDSALMCLERALGFKSDFIPSLYNKGVLLGLMGKFDEAIDTYRKVLTIEPNHNLARRDLEMLIKIKSQG